MSDMREAFEAWWGDCDLTNKEDFWQGWQAAWVARKPREGFVEVPVGWAFTSDELVQWTDAYAAFKGAFDTPQMRRQFSDEYAEDARRRLRDFNEQMLAARPKGEGHD